MTGDRPTERAPGSATGSGVWLELVGAKQGWLKRCRQAAAGDLTMIAELEDDDSAAARSLKEADTRIARSSGDPLMTAVVSYDWHVAQAIRAVALALAEPDRHDATDALLAVTDYSQEARLTSARTPPGIGPTIDPEPVTAPGPEDRFGHVLRAISSLPVETRGFAELLVSELTTRFPETLDSITVPVVFAGNTADRSSPGLHGGGSTGKLTLERLASGPPGLHPDPRTMCFLRADDAFAEGIQHAWAGAPPNVRHVCIVWTLRVSTDAAQPRADVEGGSLGGAFAVALDSLSRTTNVVQRLLRPRSLDPRCAVTASLEHHQGALAGVIGLDQKVAAASSAGLRLIVAESDVTSARQTAHNAAIHILGATTVAEAARLARGHLNPRFRNTVAAVIACALVLGIAATGMRVTDVRHATQEAAEARRHAGEQAAAQRVIESQQLASRSADLLRKDPRLAALTALAAHEVDSTPQTTTAMAMAVSHDPNLAQVAEVPPSKSAAISRSAVWLSTREGIIAYSLASMQPVGEPVPTLDRRGAHESVGLTLSPQGDRLAVLGSSTLTVYGIDQRLHLTRIASTPRPDDRLDEMFVNFSPDGRRLLMTEDDGQLWLWQTGKDRARRIEVAHRFPRDVDQAIRQVVDELGRREWTVLLNLETDDQGEILRLDLDKATIRVVRRVRTTSTATGGEFWYVASTGSGTILSSKLTGGFSRFDGKTWEQFSAADSESVDTMAVSSTGEVSVASGTDVKLLSLSDDTSGDTSTELLFRSGQGHDFSSLRYVGPHRLLAVDAGGELVMIDTAANANQRIPASVFDISPSGDSTVTARSGRKIEVDLHSTYSHERPIGPVVDTYSTTVPGGRLRDEVFQPVGTAISHRYVGVVGRMSEDTPPSDDYRWAGAGKAFVGLWSSDSRTLVVRDTCGGGGAGIDPLMSISADEDMLVATEGAIVCRWGLPSGERLPDLDLVDDRTRADSRSTDVRQLTSGGALVVVVVEEALVESEPRSRTYVIQAATGVRREIPGTFWGAAISGNGESIALVGEDGGLTFMSASTLTATRTVDLMGRTSGIAWSPDSSRLAARQRDDTIHIVDPTSGLQPVPPIFGIRGYGGGGDFSWPSADAIIVNNSFQIATVDLSHRLDWKGFICSEGAGLSESQWHESVSLSIPYRDPCQ